MRVKPLHKIFNVVQIFSLVLLCVGIVVGTYIVSTKKIMFQTKATPTGSAKIFFSIDRALEAESDFTLHVKIASEGLAVYGFQFAFLYNPAYINVERNVLTDVLKTYDPEKKLFRTVDVLEKDTKGMIKAYGVKLGDETLTPSQIIDLMDFSMKVKKNIPPDAQITFEWVTDEVKLSGEGNARILTETENGVFALGQKPLTGTSQPSPSSTDVLQGTPSPGTDIPSTTPRQTPPQSSPLTPAQQIVLNIGLKFQGIAKRIEGEKMTRPVKITLASENLKVQLSETSIFTLEDDGIWRGSSSFDAPASSDYVLYIKGPFHLQKKYCTQNPEKDTKGAKVCDRSEITLEQGENSLDFTRSIQLAGDLPEEKNVQDGVLNSRDLSLVRNNLLSSDPDILARADVNLDGAINSLDYALLLQTLNYATSQK